MSDEPRHHGGSFAPPLTAERIASCRRLAESADPAVRDAVLSLCAMADHFQLTPASSLPGEPHPCGVGTIVPLTAEEVGRIDAHVPWPHEVEAMASLFDAIPGDAEALRDAAFHLLWYARELTLDREPMTTDRL